MEKNMDEEKSIVNIPEQFSVIQYPEDEKTEPLKHAKVTLKQASSAAVKVGKTFINAPLPPSISWLYGFGFKIGILIVLKSFLIMRYQWANLSREGFLMVTSQLLLSLIFISCGLIMQTPGILEQPSKVRIVTGLYLVVGVISSYVGIRAGVEAWDYFIVPQKVNFLTGFLTGTKQLTMSIIFIDRDLWAFFAIMLFVIAIVHMCVMYGLGAVIGLFEKETDDGAKIKRFDGQSWIVTAVAAVIAIGIMIGVPKLAFMNRTQPGVSAKDFKKYVVEDAKETLAGVGFSNIELLPEYDSNGVGNVKEVSIGGNNSFGADSYFSKKSDIVITYKLDYSNIMTPKMTVYLDEENETININGNVQEGSWLSSDASVVVVDDNGELTPVSTGKAQVSAVIDGTKYTCTVTVKESNVAKAISTWLQMNGETIGTKIKEGTGEVIDKAQEGIEKIGEGVKESAEKIGTSVKEGLEATGDGVKGLFEKITGK